MAQRQSSSQMTVQLPGNRAAVIVMPDDAGPDDTLMVIQGALQLAAHIATKRERPALSRIVLPA